MTFNDEINFSIASIDISKGENVFLGDKEFKVFESPGKVTFFNNDFFDDEKGLGISVSGGFNNNDGKLLKEEIIGIFERRKGMNLETLDVFLKQHTNSNLDMKYQYAAEDNVWVQNKITGEETLSRTFGDKKVFFKIDTGGRPDGAGFSFYPDEQSLKKANAERLAPDYILPGSDVNKSVNVFEKIADAAIMHFYKNKNFSTDDMREYLRSKVENVKAHDLMLPEDALDFFSKKELEDVINQQQEDVWYPNYDKQSSLELDESLKHTFGDKTVKFGIWIMYPTENISETTLVCGGESERESFSNRTQFDIKGNADAAKQLVANTIKRFDQKQGVNLFLIESYLYSQIMEMHDEAEIKNPQNLTVQLAKKAGYVQGVCECVAAIGDDHTLGKKLLSEMNVNKDMAKKYANPETYKALEQGIFAPQQKLEQTRSIKL